VAPEVFKTSPTGNGKTAKNCKGGKKTSANFRRIFYANARDGGYIKSVAQIINHPRAAYAGNSFLMKQYKEYQFMKTFLRYFLGGFIFTVMLFYLWLMWRVLLFVFQHSRKRRYYVLLDSGGNILQASTDRPSKMQQGQRQYLLRARNTDDASTLAQAAFKKSFKDHGHEAMGDDEE